MFPFVSPVALYVVFVVVYEFPGHDTVYELIVENPSDVGTFQLISTKLSPGKPERFTGAVAGLIARSCEDS